jgi:hypothetical protein
VIVNGRARPTPRAAVMLSPEEVMTHIRNLLEANDVLMAIIDVDNSVVGPGAKRVCDRIASQNTNMINRLRGKGLTP